MPDVANRIAWLTITAVFASASILFFFKDPVLGNDSASYIDMDIIRPAGYPLFLKFLSLFTDSFLELAVVIQTIFNAVVLFFFLWWVCDRFKLSSLFSLLLMPIAVYYMAWMVKPNVILSESLAYPLFLLLVTSFSDALLRREMKGIYIALAINVLLVIIRGQFLFNYPFLFLGGFYILFRTDKVRNLKHVSVFLFALIGSYLATPLINNTYHLAVHNTFSNAQSNLNFIRIALYISEEEDSQLFEDRELQQLHTLLYETLYEEGLNADAFYDKIRQGLPTEERRRSDLIEHYHANLIHIGTVLRGTLIRNKYRDLNWYEYVEKRSDIFSELSKTVLKEHTGMYVYLIAAEIFMYGFGGNRALAIFLFLLFLIATIGLLKENRYGELIFFFFSAHLMNLLIMAASNRVLYRYSFYLEIVLFTFLLVVFLKTVLQHDIIDKPYQPTFSET